MTAAKPSRSSKPAAKAAAAKPARAASSSAKPAAKAVSKPATKASKPATSRAAQIDKQVALQKKVAKQAAAQSSAAKDQRHEKNLTRTFLRAHKSEELRQAKALGQLAAQAAALGMTPGQYHEHQQQQKAEAQQQQQGQQPAGR